MLHLFRITTLLPFARQITSFYDKRYGRNEKGKLAIQPGNALEDVWGCTNPAPEIAGLRFILPQLIKIVSSTEEKETYARLLKAIPDLPVAVSPEGSEYLLPAETGQRRGNCEKPECYAIFPYRLFGVGLPGIELAREWNCSFKLHAPGKTVVQGELKNGKLVNLAVTPESRRKDIVNYLHETARKNSGGSVPGME